MKPERRHTSAADPSFWLRDGSAGNERTSRLYPLWDANNMEAARGRRTGIQLGLKYIRIQRIVCVGEGHEVGRGRGGEGVGRKRTSRLYPLWDANKMEAARGRRTGIQLGIKYIRIQRIVCVGRGKGYGGEGWEREGVERG